MKLTIMPFTIKCSKCGLKSVITNNMLEYSTDSQTRNSGTEYVHKFEYRSKCKDFNSIVWLEYNAWEYPCGIINWKELEIHNAKWVVEPTHKEETTNV